MIMIEFLGLNQIMRHYLIALALADNRATKEASLAVPWITPPPELFSPFSSTPLNEIDKTDSYFSSIRLNMKIKFKTFNWIRS